MLTIRNVSKRLGSRTILREVSLDFDGPGVAWIRGENGAGKSTILKCVAGIWRPDQGDIRLGGLSILNESRSRKQIGYVPDRFEPFPDLTVAEVFSLVASLKQCPPPCRSALQRFGVDHFEHRPIGRLSSGQSRRVALTAALIGDPWLLVLDEPTTGLDQQGTTSLIELLAERGKTGKAALLVTHDLALALAVSSYIYDMKEGRLSLVRRSADFDRSIAPCG